MTADELMTNIGKNMYKLFDNDVMLEILDKSNNLNRFDTFNKIALVLLRTKEITDVRSEDEWNIFGRHVVNRDNKMYIAIPKDSKVYVDAETGEHIDITEFSMRELEIAMNKGIIKMKTEVNTEVVQTVYDISDTVADNGTDTVDVPKVTLRSLIDITQTLTGVSIERGEGGLSYYSKKENNLYLSEGTHKDVALNVINVLVTKFTSDEMINKAIEDNFDNKISKNDIDIDKLKVCTEYEIATMFGIDKRTKVKEAIRINSKEDVSNMLNIIRLADYFSFIVFQLLEYMDKSFVKDASSNISEVNKAKFMRRLIESFTVQYKLRLR